MATMPEFRTVRLLQKTDWFGPDYLKNTQVGDLLLLGDTAHRPGGILRIKKASVFISLTKEQVWDGAFVTWPRERDGIKGFYIRGNRVVFESK